MTRGVWHIAEGEGGLTLARRWPPRQDVWAQAEFPPLRRAALAHEIRKDLWRALRHVRGLSPVVVLAHREGGLRVRAGARIDGGRPPGGLAHRIDAVLTDPARRARWCNHARSRST